MGILSEHITTHQSLAAQLGSVKFCEDVPPCVVGAQCLLVGLYFVFCYNPMSVFVITIMLLLTINLQSSERHFNKRVLQPTVNQGGFQKNICFLGNIIQKIDHIMEPFNPHTFSLLSKIYS